MATFCYCCLTKCFDKCRYWKLQWIIKVFEFKSFLYQHKYDPFWQAAKLLSKYSLILALFFSVSRLSVAKLMCFLVYSLINNKKIPWNTSIPGYNRNTWVETITLRSRVVLVWYMNLLAGPIFWAKRACTCNTEHTRRAAGWTSQKNQKPLCRGEDHPSFHLCHFCHH